MAWFSVWQTNRNVLALLCIRVLRILFDCGMWQMPWEQTQALDTAFKLHTIQRVPVKKPMVAR